MDKLVATGALGHIGSRLIRDLPRSFPKAEIVLVDNLLTQRHCALFNLPTQGRYRFVEEDILKADLDALFADAEAVIHLAAITDATSSFHNREMVEAVNFGGTRRVAEACARARAGLIFLSTTSVYGPQTEFVDEDCAPGDLKPQSPYAETKLRSEAMLSEMAGATGLQFVTCRFGTIFGPSPGMRFHTVVNKFVWQACAGTPLAVWRGALRQMRPYLDLGDAVRAIAHILDRRLFDCRTYNVLTFNATVDDIVRTLRARVPDLRVEYVDSPILNQLSYAVSCERFKAQGFTFTGDLSREIERTIELLSGMRSALFSNRRSPGGSP